MHCRGFAFVSEPTDEAVAIVMEPHRETYVETDEGEEEGGRFAGLGHWDWYRPGGRYDGYLVSDAEMAARQTDHGFNFSPENGRVDRNSCLASVLPTDRRDVYFFVAGGEWRECETYRGGEFVDVPDFPAQLDAALAAHQDQYVVVIDAHW